MPVIVAIDIETTGLNDEYCQILELGAIYNDSERRISCSNMWRTYLPVVRGEPFALHMNAAIIKDADKKENIKIEHLGINFKDWLDSCGRKEGEKFTIAGKNFGTFDSRFLRKVIHFPWDYFHHRQLDMGNLWLTPSDMGKIPDTKECAKRAGLDIKNYELHTTLGDCRLVMDLFAAWHARELRRNS